MFGAEVVFFDTVNKYYQEQYSLKIKFELDKSLEIIVRYSGINFIAFVINNIHSKIGIFGGIGIDAENV